MAFETARDGAYARMHRVRLADSPRIAAEEALRLADTRFRQGAALLLEVLDAQASLTRARTERVRPTASFNRAPFRLLRAVGDLRASNRTEASGGASSRASRHTGRGGV